MSASVMSETGRPIVSLEASCACGRVTVRVAGRVKSMLMCSCLDCQKATGTGHSSVAVFAAGDVAVTGPTHAFARPAASGATTTRWFCPNCGTPLQAQSSRAEGLLLLPVGLFGGGDWFAPSQLIFSRSHEAWDVVDPELPRHATYRGGS